MSKYDDVDVLEVMHVDRHALRYFGILRFTDMPGFFPDLKIHGYPDDDTGPEETDSCAGQAGQ